MPSGEKAYPVRGKKSHSAEKRAESLRYGARGRYHPESWVDHDGVGEVAITCFDDAGNYGIYDFDFCRPNRLDWFGRPVSYDVWLALGSGGSDEARRDRWDLTRPDPTNDVLPLLAFAMHVVRR
jgi:hypothetical protein